jgi:RNA polymerase sigma factor (sigma-70 family)
VEASVSPSPSDEILAQRLAGGDETAFDELYRRYSAPLARHGARILRDVGAGEDVAQTALLRAYRSIRGGTTPENVRAWLYTIAQRTAFDSRGRGELEYDPEQDGRPDRAFELGPSGADLVAAIQSLPERQRQAYLLRELRGLSMGEIGRELGLSSQQVEQALFAARNKLATRLSFGGELSCDTVRRIDKRDLDLGGRRALKAHLRTCPDCREAVGGRLGGWISSLGLLSGIRGLIANTVGGGGGGLVAAKVGTALVVGGLGVATPIAAYHAHLFHSSPSRAPRTTVTVAPESLGPTAGLANPAFAGLPSLKVPGTNAEATRGGTTPPASPALAPPSGTTPDPSAGPSGTLTAGNPSTPADPTAAPSGDEQPVDTQSADATPTDETSTDATPTDTTPTDTTPTDTTPTDTTPTDSTPTDSTPTDTTPTDSTPTDTTPVDTTPLNTTLVDTTPTDLPPSG